MSGWLERQGNYLSGSGDNSLLGDVEKGFENIGRVKVTDLSEESKSELGKYFDWKDGDEIDVCLGGTFAGDKFISIINRTRSNTTKK